MSPDEKGVTVLPNGLRLRVTPSVVVLLMPDGTVEIGDTFANRYYDRAWEVIEDDTDVVLLGEWGWVRKVDLLDERGPWRRCEVLP